MNSLAVMHSDIGSVTKDQDRTETFIGVLVPVFVSAHHNSTLYSICGLQVLFFVSSWCVNLFRLALCEDALRRFAYMRAKPFLFVNKSRIYGEDSAPY